MLYNTSMIGYLKGTVLHHDTKSVILDVGGVGYKIHTYIGILESDGGSPVSFWTYLAVRENALDLYGFQTKQEIEFFELLLTISGIGPKSAMGILSVANISTLRKAIISGDTSHLTKISGIGKKVAEKIVLELKDKVGSGGDFEMSTESDDIDALEALKSLGYSERDAREALKKAEGSSTEQKVRSALKKLNS